MKTIQGFEALRLMSAFQVLTVPSGAMGVTHKRAKEVIFEITGKRVRSIAGFKPGVTLEAYLLEFYKGEGRDHEYAKLPPREAT
jgi:hypothetical protein